MGKVNLRILNCLHRSHLAGAQWRVVWVGECLAPHGIETIPLFPANRELAYEKELRSRGLRYVRQRMPILRKSLLANGLFLCTLPLLVVALMRRIRELDIDIVHVNGATNLQPVLAGLLAHRPVIWHLNDMLTPYWFVRLLRPLFRHKRVQLVVATAAIVEHYQLTDEPTLRWTVLPAPVPPLHRGATQVLTKGALGIPEDAVVIGFTGYLVPAKGCEDFLEVVMHLMRTEARLHAIIVGAEVHTQTAYAQLLRRKVAGSGYASRIHFVGFQSDLPAWLRLFDVFLFPSHSEACPIAVLEAMQAGVPLVVTRVGEISRMMGDLPVPVVEPRDITALRDGLVRILALSKPQRHALGMALSARATQMYSLATVSHQHLLLYREVWRQVPQ
jgi:glycosyltransferase involved in cell wall biosynthesis